MSSEFCKELILILEKRSYRRKTRVSKLLTRTPEKLAEYFAKLINCKKTNKFVLDLMAGDGRITKYLTCNCCAVEKNRKHFLEGTKFAEDAFWIHADIFTKPFLDLHMECDAIISNPEFETAMAALLVASKFVKPKGLIYFLLPTNFFTGSIKRARMYQTLPVEIVKEIKVGNWNYYEEEGTGKKIIDDSIFVFKKCKPRSSSKFTWTTQIEPLFFN